MLKRYSGSGKLKGIAIILLMGLLTLSLFACGSGGGGGSSSNHPSSTTNSSILTGVAATGAPMSGGIVYLKEADGTEHGPYPIDNNGRYSIDVTGFTPPFYLRAERITGGQTTILYSVSMGAGTANINPLTNLAIAAAGIVNDPADVYNDPVIRPIAQGALNKAITDILALMAPVLNNPKYKASNINPLTDGKFTANGKGLDGVFDDLDLDLDIKITPGVVKINLNGKPIGQVQLNKLDAPDDEIFDQEVEDALGTTTLGSVSGDGTNRPPDYTAGLSVDTGASWLEYAFDSIGLNFEATSINDPIKTGNTVTITGEGIVTRTMNGVTETITGSTFTATITDGLTDAMSMEIRKSDNTLYYLATSQTLIAGNYTFTE